MLFLWKFYGYPHIFQYLVLLSMTEYFILFYFILLYFISFHYILFYFIIFYFIPLHFISFHFISFHFISFHFISFHNIFFTLFSHLCIRIKLQLWWKLPRKDIEMSLMRWSISMQNLIFRTAYVHSFHTLPEYNYLIHPFLLFDYTIDISILYCTRYFLYFKLFASLFFNSNLQVWFFHFILFLFFSYFFLKSLFLI